MVKIDVEDSRILYELDFNSRQTLTQIGKNIGLKKDVVSYRVQRMQEEGVIKNFWTAINTFKLGYQVYRIYINFQYVNQNIKKTSIFPLISFGKILCLPQKLPFQLFEEHSKK